MYVTNAEARAAFATLTRWASERRDSTRLLPVDKYKAFHVGAALAPLAGCVDSQRETDGTDSTAHVEPRMTLLSDTLRKLWSTPVRPPMPTDVVGMTKEAQLAADEAWMARCDAEMKAAMDKAADKATPPIVRQGQTWQSKHAGDSVKVLAVSQDQVCVASCDNGATAWVPTTMLTDGAVLVEDGWTRKFENRLWAELMTPEPPEPKDD